jgi:CRISPR-associated endonuclease Csn1
MEDVLVDNNKPITAKRVLGLDIGSNSIGFSLLDLYFKNNVIVFDEIASNSIVFSEPTEAKDRREARGDKRRNKRKSARKKNTRRLFVKYKLADKDFILHPSNFLNKLTIDNTDVYNIRAKAVDGLDLTKDEFLFCTYSILTDRGYSNMFSISNEDGVINEAVIKNSEIYETKSYKLPSMVLTEKRDDKSEYQNFSIRNKKDDYQNSLDRDMHKEEFRKVVLSQENNQNIFESPSQCAKFIDEIFDESKVNSPFYQRPLRSFEDMVEYCTFYNAYHPKYQEKRVPLSHIKNIELTLRQKIDNYEVKNTKTGELFSFSEEFYEDEIDKIINFWLLSPNANVINAKNLFKNAGFKDIVLFIPEKSSQVVLDIKSHRNILEVFKKYEIDFSDKDYELYNELLLVLYYFKNYSSRVERIDKLCTKYKRPLEKEAIDEMSYLENMDGFASFSLKFTDEVLSVMKNENKTHHEALEKLGYYSKYLDMPVYDYLPPLNPTKADIEWLKKNLSYFDTTHLFYQPMISPKVRRVIAVLRKLVNDLISKYGKIDEIRIETAKELNSKKEKERIDESQKKGRDKNSKAEKFLKENDIKISSKNIEIAKLFSEQMQNGCQCLYSGEPITLDEAFDENTTEIEHFIPRSTIWINSYKNKILVKKEYNRNKLDKHPIAYLKSIVICQPYIIQIIRYSKQLFHIVTSFFLQTQQVTNYH